MSLVKAWRTKASPVIPDTGDPCLNRTLKELVDWVLDLGDLLNDDNIPTGTDVSSTTPVDVDATAAAVGSEEEAARGDHRHHLGSHHAVHETGGGDEVTPIVHHTRHESGGADAIKLDDLAAPDVNTDLDASATKHGLAPKGSGDSTQFLNGNCAWSAPVAKWG